MIISPGKWFERKFTLGLPPEYLQPLIERLRGTPARLEERLQNVPRERLLYKPESSWSIQEHVGHLGDLEELWLGRIDDFRKGVIELRAADLENRKTREAKHNYRKLWELLEEFREWRLDLVTAIEDGEPDLLKCTALHPRLQQPMSIVDHAFFVAEHDDHHLAAISALLRLQK